MKQIALGVVATTHRLSNGTEFSKDDLESFATQMLSQAAVGHDFFNVEHREDQAPFGKLVKAWVDRFRDKQGTESPKHHALYVEVEIDTDLSLEECTAMVEGKGLSVSFFSEGVANWSPENGSEDLLIGVSPSLLNQPYAAEHILGDVATSFPDVKISVRNYHEHSAVAGTVVLMSFSLWLLDKVAGKLVDHVVELALNRIPKHTVGSPEAIKMQFQTRNGKVDVYIPVTEDTSGLQKAIAQSVESALEHHVSGDARPVGITYDRQYQKTVIDKRPAKLDRRV